MAYVTVRAVLAEAGLHHPEVGEVLSGTVNGSNTVFTTARKPLCQQTDGASVTTADVTAYVNGSPVTVSTLNATTGAFTLQAAPANGTTVTGDYAYSSVAQTDVTGAIEEATEWIDLALTNVYEVSSPVPATIRKIARFYAAGLLMAREYGLESITEETTKEGQRKLKQAEEWLTSYRATLIENAADTGDYDTPRSTADQRLFDTYNSTDGRWEPGTDDVMVNRRV